MLIFSCILLYAHFLDMICIFLTPHFRIHNSFLNYNLFILFILVNVLVILLFANTWSNVIVYVYSIKYLCSYLEGKFYIKLYLYLDLTFFCSVLQKGCQLHFTNNVEIFPMSLYPWLICTLYVLSIIRKIICYSLSLHFVCTYVCMYVCIHIYIYTHTYISHTLKLTEKNKKKHWETESEEFC